MHRHCDWKKPCYGYSSKTLLYSRTNSLHRLNQRKEFAPSASCRSSLELWYVHPYSVAAAPSASLHSMQQHGWILERSFDDGDSLELMLDEMVANVVVVHLPILLDEEEYFLVFHYSI